MNNQCPICGKALARKSKAVKCKICKKNFHTKCATITDATYNLVKSGSVNWKCSSCPAELNESIAVLSGDEDTTIESEDDDTNNANVIGELSSFDLSNCTMDKMALVLKTLVSVIMEFHKSQNHFSLQMDDILKQNKTFYQENQNMKKKIELAEKKTEDLERKVNHLESLLDEVSQQKYCNNIVLAGLPPNVEDCTSVVIQIAGKIGANITNADIKKVVPLQQQVKSENLSKPLYVVELNSSSAKKELMQKKNN